MGLVRLLLALSVVITHSSPVFGMVLLDGDMAITGFFIISGFLMALILDVKYRDRLRAFYLNRLLRIYPPYLVALLLSVIVFSLFPNEHHGPAKVFTWLLEREAWQTLSVAVITNVTLVGINLTRYMSVEEPSFQLIFPNFLQPGVGFGGHNLLFVPQGWTLALELYFYLLAPLVCRLRTIVLVGAIVGLFYLSEEARQYLRHGGIDFPPDASFPFQLKYFLLGVLGYRIMQPLQKAIEADFFAAEYLPTLSLAAAILLVFAGSYMNDAGLDTEIFYLMFASTVPGMFLFGRDRKWDGRLGEYSYPVYLFHYMISTSADNWVPVDMMVFPTIALTLAISTGYIHFIDRPIMAYRAKISDQAKA